MAAEPQGPGVAPRRSEGGARPDGTARADGYGEDDTARFYAERHRSQRDDFARDRARVLHSAALRRLAAKTQVLSPASPADFARNRLTHSLEVAQVGRELATALGLSPDVVDTACLSHDLGHPPFGHNGERALNEWADDIGGFEGNAQSLRILTRLEPKTLDDSGRSYGLNLTRASLDAACKYPWTAEHPLPDAGGRLKFGVYPDDEPVFRWLRDGAPGRVRCIEAEAMDLSDDIAYSVHDFEDAIVNGYLNPARFADAGAHDALVTAIQHWVGFDFARDELDDALYRLRRMPQWLTSYDASRADLARLKNLTSDLIGRFARAATTATREAYPGPVLTRYRAHVVVPRVIEAEMAVLKGIIGAFVVTIEGRKALYKEQRRVLKRLANALWDAGPGELDPVFAADFATAETDAGRRRVVVDQVASLTDQVALAWHARLIGEVDAGSIGIWGASRSPRGGPLMPGRIAQADVDEVKARTRIADIIGERVVLKSAGVGSLKGLCPFHDERSPSFNVRDQAGFYHCFGCGESGDVYSFLRKMDHVSFQEAVERLAARIGYTLHYEDGGPAPETSGRARLYAANAAAAEWFRAQLMTPEAEIGRRFLGERGFDAGAAAHFGVGFAPKGWEGMTDALVKQGFTRDELSAAGLVSQGQRGVYDRFRGRLVWPIRDVTGQTVGFGARRLFDDDNGPKYLNTPETTIYHKAQVLYGLDLAKRDISRGEPRRVVVVEGYTDVMACHLAGVTTAVATCGTAFGGDHISVLRRVMGDESAAGEVVFTFDPDAAGQKAALRAFAEAKRFNAQTFVAVAPDGLDPCDLRIAKGDTAVRALMDAKVPMVEFVLDQRIAPFDRSTVEGRVGALRAAAPVVAELRDPLLQPEYIRVLARRLGLDPTDVRREVGRASHGGSSTPAQHRSAEPPAAEGAARASLAALPRTKDVALERDALMGFLQYGHRMEPGLRERATTLAFRHPALDAVRVAVAGRIGDADRAGWAMDAVEAVREPYRGLAAELLAADFPARDEEGAVASATSLALALLARALDAEKSELLGAVQRVPADSEQGRALRVRLRDLDAERRGLAADQ